MDDFLMTPKTLELLKGFSEFEAKNKGVLRIITGSGIKENGMIFATCFENEYALNFGGEYEIVKGWYEDKYLKIKVKIKNLGEKKGCFFADNLAAFDINGVELKVADYKDYDEKSIDNGTQLLPGAECEKYIYIPYEKPYIFLSLVIEDEAKESEDEKYLLIMLETGEGELEKEIDKVYGRADDGKKTENMIE